MIASGDTERAMVRDRRRLQCHGHRLVGEKPRRSVQRLWQAIQLEDGPYARRPTSVSFGDSSHEMLYTS